MNLDKLDHRVVVLIGAMGAGKTAVGRQLAREWGVGFRDTDHDVETTTGRTISDIFVEDGESAFRELEKAAVVEALASHDGVLALGGGAVLDADTRDALRGHTVVFLQVGLAEAVRRVGLGTSRPLLLGNVRGRIKQLLDERTPIYEGLATISVQTDHHTTTEVVTEVRVALEARQDGNHG